MFAEQVRSLLSPSNPVFTRPRQGKWIPNALVATIVFALFVLVAFGGCAIGLKLVTGDSGQADRLLDGTFGLFVPFGLVTLLVLLWVRFVEKRPIATLGLMRAGALFGYAQGFVLGLVFMAVVVGVMALGGGVNVQTDGAQPSGYAALGSILIMLAAYIVQAGTEEVHTRGWFMQVLGARYRPWIAVLVTSVIFSAMHWAPNPLAIVNLFLFGLFLALYSLRAGNIWGICGWHAAWNWTMGNVFGLAVSGNEQTGVLFDLQTTGHPLLTGGDFGPEGSLVTTAVFLAGIAVVIMVRKETRPEST